MDQFHSSSSKTYGQKKRAALGICHEQFMDKPREQLQFSTKKSLYSNKKQVYNGM